MSSRDRELRLRIVRSVRKITYDAVYVDGRVDT